MWKWNQVKLLLLNFAGVKIFLLCFRCVVDYLSKKIGKSEISLLSPKGDILRGVRHGHQDVQVEQGKPRLIQMPDSSATIDLAEFGLVGEVGIAVDIGNPHLVIFLKDRYIL